LTLVVWHFYRVPDLRAGPFFVRFLELDPPPEEYSVPVQPLPLEDFSIMGETRGVLEGDAARLIVDHLVVVVGSVRPILYEPGSQRLGGAALRLETVPHFLAELVIGFDTLWRTVRSGQRGLLVEHELLGLVQFLRTRAGVSGVEVEGGLVEVVLDGQPGR